MDSKNMENASATTLYAVRHTRIEKLPYAEDNDEYMPGCYTKVYTESTEDDFDKDKDLAFTYMDELIRLYYERQNKACPIEIKPFDDLLEQTITGVDGESYFMDGYENYVDCFGLEFENIFWIRSVPVFACIATSQKGAERFIEEHRAELSDPQIVPIEAGKPLSADQVAQFPF